MLPQRFLSIILTPNKSFKKLTKKKLKSIYEEKITLINFEKKKIFFHKDHLSPHKINIYWFFFFFNFFGLLLIAKNFSFAALRFYAKLAIKLTNDSSLKRSTKYGTVFANGNCHQLLDGAPFDWSFGVIQMSFLNDLIRFGSIFLYKSYWHFKITTVLIYSVISRLQKRLMRKFQIYLSFIYADFL